MVQEDESRIPGERAETVSGGKIDSNPVLRRGAVALAVAAFVAFALWSVSGEKTPADITRPERVVIRQAADFEPAKERLEPVQQVPEVKLPTPVVSEEVKEEDPLLDSARRAPVMAFSGGPKNTTSHHETADPLMSGDTNFVPLDGNIMGQNSANTDEQRFNGLLRPTKLEGSRAGALGNRNFIVAMGTSIPCVLETALASDQPGFTSCVINRDVLSDNGRVVLMEKGTQVVGEYRGGLQRGQKRLFVLWNRAKTPNGVIVTLASPATDALGRAGVDGYVDTHWWERFGSALSCPSSATPRAMPAAACRRVTSTLRTRQAPASRRPQLLSSNPSTFLRRSTNIRANSSRSLWRVISISPASTGCG